jgi:hypothetical protein
MRSRSVGRRRSLANVITPDMVATAVEHRAVRISGLKISLQVKIANFTELHTLLVVGS